MRRFWFAVSLAVVFIFAAAASYIFMALNFSPRQAAPELDEPYKVAGELVSEVKVIEPADALLIREVYLACGHEVQTPGDAGLFLGRSYDQLAEEGWAVAELGAGRVELSREQPGLCPQEAGQRLLVRTGRGLQVFEGTREHPGSLLLEMPVDFDELPPQILASLEDGGWQLASQAELDELLESLDELLLAEPAV